jgi:hypothetical protein
LVVDLVLLLVVDLLFELFLKVFELIQEFMVVSLELRVGLGEFLDLRV